ncbi:MAG: radical SAM protein [Nitrospinae bacterium]|nr:radical SAM protein [Nitrospinota bacterium]
MGRFKKVALLKGIQRLEPPSYTFSSDLTELCHLAAFIEQDVDDIQIPVGVYEKNPYEKFRQSIRKSRFDLVGISAMTCGYNSAQKFAQVAKEEGAFVVLGGYHPTALPDEVLANPNVDAVIRGEGELTLRELTLEGASKHVAGLSFKDQGEIIHNLDRPLIENLDVLPMPLRKIRPSRFGEAGDQYSIDSVYSSRGCIAKCTFCSNDMVNKMLRNRSPEHFVAELELLHDPNQQRVVKFWDSVFMFDAERVEKIVELMFKKNLTNFNIITESRSNDVIRCKHLLKDMKRVGFKKLQIGIESPNPETFKLLRKGGSNSKHEEAIRLVKEHNMKLEAFFIIGHPNESEEDVKKYPEFVDRLGIEHGALFFVMTPYPGTQIFREYREKNLIESYNWDSYNNYGAVIHLEKMSREHLLNLLAYCYGNVQGIPYAFKKGKTLPRFFVHFLGFSFIWLYLFELQGMPEKKTRNRFFEYLFNAGLGTYQKKRVLKPLSRFFGLFMNKFELVFIIDEEKALLISFAMNKDELSLEVRYTDERDKGKKRLSFSLDDLEEVRTPIDMVDLNALMFMARKKKSLLTEGIHYLPNIMTTLGAFISLIFRTLKKSDYPC